MMKFAGLLALAATVKAMDTSADPGEDITVITNTPAVHRVSWTAQPHLTFCGADGVRVVCVRVCSAT